jgi:hypothetical protein
MRHEGHPMSDPFQGASEELLYANLRNKEAARHHQSGAFKAALHLAKLCPGTTDSTRTNI